MQVLPFTHGAHPGMTGPFSILGFQSSFGSDKSGNCVEVAPLEDGRTAVRNSNQPSAGVVFFTVAEMDAWIKAGEFDDLTLA